MLVISRRTSESFIIEPAAGVDLDTTLREVFARGAIEVRVIQTGRSKVRFAVDAPSQLKIWRRGLVLDRCSSEVSTTEKEP